MHETTYRLEKGDCCELHAGMQIEFVAGNMNAPIYLVQSVDTEKPGLILTPLNIHNNKSIHSIGKDTLLGRSTPGFTDEVHMSRVHAQIHFDNQSKTFIYFQKGRNSAAIVSPPESHKQIKDIQHFLDTASLLMAEKVQSLEERTLMRPRQEEGYYASHALYGYRILLKAFELIHEGSLDEEEKNALIGSETILTGLESDSKKLDAIRRLLRERNLIEARENQTAYIAQKMEELKETGEIFLNGGHREHYNIICIRKQPDGSYTHTKYDAGGEAEIVRVSEDKTEVTVNAVITHTLKPPFSFLHSSSRKTGDMLEHLIYDHAMKYNTPYNSPEYANAVRNVESYLVRPPIYAKEERGQRKGNCTTRSQRQLLAEIMPPRLFENLYRFVANPEEVNVEKIEGILKEKKIALETYCEKLDEKVKLHRLNIDDFLEGDVLAGFEDVTKSSIPQYRTKLGILNEKELIEFKRILLQWGYIFSRVVESNSQPGQFCLAISNPPEDIAQRVEKAVQKYADFKRPFKPAENWTEQVARAALSASRTVAARQ